MLATQEPTQTDALAVPSSLIYEVLNGRPLYYRGYKEVLAKNLVKIDLSEFDGIEFNYIAEKNQRLFDFGVERVLWVLSKPRRVMVAVPNQDWIFTDWGNDIPVIESCVLNVKNLLAEEGIAY